MTHARFISLPRLGGAVALTLLSTLALTGCGQEKTKSLDDMTAAEVAKVIGCDQPDITKTMQIAEEEFSCGSGQSPDLSAIKYKNAADAEGDLVRCVTSVPDDRRCVAQGRWLFDGASTHIGRVQQAFGIPDPTIPSNQTSPGPSGQSGDPATADGTETSEFAAPSLKAGQTAKLDNLGLEVKATWAEFDKEVSTGDGPHDNGCTWVDITATNTGSADFMATPVIGGEGSEPQMSFQMEAGDTLRTVDGVSAEGAGEWPHRIKAGKTETWRQCFMADEREQHLTLTAFWSDNNGPSNRLDLATWNRS